MTRTKTRALANWPNNAVSVLDYGAVGDGVTNENQAISDAFDVVVAAGGGTVYFPAGTYIVTTKFEYSGVNIAIRGDSRSNTIIKYGSATNGKIFKINDGDNCTVSDLTFDFNGSTKEFADSIAVNKCKNVEIRNCQFLDLNPQKLGDITIGTGNGGKKEFTFVKSSYNDYQIMPGTVVVTAGTVQLSDEELADGHLFLKDPILDENGRIALNQTTQGQILYGSNNGEFAIRVKFQTAPADGVPVTLNAGYSDQRQPILILNCTDVLINNNILKCLGRIKIGRPGNRVIVTNNIINGCNDNGITLVNIAPSNADPDDPGSLSPQPKLINRDLLIQNNIINHAATTGIFFGGDGGPEAVFPLEFYNIQITNNNITTSGGSGIKFTPSSGSGSQERSGQIIIANNNIDMQYITKSDGTPLKVPGSFTAAINLGSGSNGIMVSNNNIDASGSYLGCVSYTAINNCVFSGNTFKNTSSRAFRGNGSALIENSVFSDNTFNCSIVMSPQDGDASLIRDTTFLGNTMVSDNTLRNAGSFINGGALEDVIISNNIFMFADGITVDSTPLSAVYLSNPIESSFQITNNRFVGSTWWNPDVIRTSAGVTFAPGSIKFPNSGPTQKTFQTGEGTPEGAVFAYRGSIFIDEETGEVYSKASGGNTSNTGWVTPQNLNYDIPNRRNDILINEEQGNRRPIQRAPQPRDD